MRCASRIYDVTHTKTVPTNGLTLEHHLHMAKVHEIGSSSIKSVFCLAYQHGFPNHFKNNLGGKVSRRRIRACIVLYMWGEYFIDILAHKVGKSTNIGHFGYVQFANYGNQCLTVKS